LSMLVSPDRSCRVGRWIVKCFVFILFYFLFVLPRLWGVCKAVPTWSCALLDVASMGTIPKKFKIYYYIERTQRVVSGCGLCHSTLVALKF
jgi:hypothetical protein